MFKACQAFILCRCDLFYFLNEISDNDILDLFLAVQLKLEVTSLNLFQRCWLSLAGGLRAAHFYLNHNVSRPSVVNVLKAKSFTQQMPEGC